MRYASAAAFVRRLVSLQVGVMREQIKDILKFRAPPPQFDAVRIADEFLAARCRRPSKS